MINIDGSHESWLIYSDWLEDNDNPLCHQIRSDLEEEIDNWTFEHCYHREIYSSCVGGGGFLGEYVGGYVGGVHSIRVYGRVYGSDVGGDVGGVGASDVDGGFGVGYGGVGGDIVRDVSGWRVADNDD